MFTPGSNVNYFLHNNGKPLTGVSVTIDITEDMVCPLAFVNGVSQIPANFSFQLNACSSLTGDAAWQQFIFNVRNSPTAVGISESSPSTAGAILSAIVETWPSVAFAAAAGFGSGADLIKSDTPANYALYSDKTATLPGQKLPAGYRLIISLGNDSNNNINSATFTALDTLNHNKLIMTETIPFSKFVTDGPVNPVTTPDLSPIVAFELNIVGNYGGPFALLLQGAGKIAYDSSGPLTAKTSLPSFAGTNFGGQTGETANTVYGPMPAGEMLGQTQTFGVITYPVGGFLAAAPRVGVSNQTDVYAVGSTGQLGVFSVQAAGSWIASPPLGPPTFPPAGPAFAPPGAPLAVSPQFGASSQTDVFVVDNNGHLNVFWSNLGGGWSGPLQISEPGFAAPPGAWVAAGQRFGTTDQTDVYVVDNHGQLNVFSVVGAGAWSTSHKIGAAGFARPGAGLATSNQYGLAHQTDVFVVDQTGQLNVFWIEGSGSAWQGPQAIGGAGFSAPSGAPLTVSPQFGISRQTDVFVIDNTGQLNVFYVVGATGWGRVKIGPAFYPDPSGALNAQPGTQVVVSQRFGVAHETDVYEVDIRGDLTTFSVIAAGAWSQSQTIRQTSQSGLCIGAGSFLAAAQQFGAVNQTDLFVLNSMTPWISPGLGWPNVLWATGAGSWAGPAPLGLLV